MDAEDTVHGNLLDMRTGFFGVIDPRLGVVTPGSSAGLTWTSGLMGMSDTCGVFVSARGVRQRRAMASRVAGRTMSLLTPPEPLALGSHPRRTSSQPERGVTCEASPSQIESGGRLAMTYCVYSL